MHQEVYQRMNRRALQSFPDQTLRYVASYVLAIRRAAAVPRAVRDPREGQVRAGVKASQLVHVALIFKPQRLYRGYRKNFDCLWAIFFLRISFLENGTFVCITGGCCLWEDKHSLI